MARRVSEIIDADVAEKLSIWTEVMLKENSNTILQEDDNMGKAELVRALKKYGYIDRWNEESRLEGRQEGWEVGITEEKQRTARAMKADGMDITTISRITGLPIDEIK